MLDDKDVCAALGVDVDGRCLRHPNISVVVSQTGRRYQDENKGSVDDAVGDNVSSATKICSCLICRSEIASGGHMQRKSMAYAIQSVQNLHGNKQQWNAFKQNWTDVDGNDGDDSHVSNKSMTDDQHNQKGDQEYIEEEKKDSKSLGGDNHQDEIQRALLRASQVQRWNMIEKDKEIETLKRQLEESQLKQQRMRREFDQEKEELEETIADLESKVKKQEKTINQELRMIKSIATKRAGARANLKSTPEGENPYFHVKHSNSVVSREAPPQIPARKASEKAGEEPDVIAPPRKHVSLSVVATTRDQHPKLPIRQTCDQHQIGRVLSALKPSAVDSFIEMKYPIDRNISFNNHQNNVAPSIPLRQPSQESELINQISGHTVSMHSAAENSIESSTDIFVQSEVTMDTNTGDVLYLALEDDQKHQLDDPLDIGSPDVVKSKISDPTDPGSHEISFVPTEMEIMSSPRPPSQSPESTHGKGRNGKAGAGHASSQEIQFDASTTFHDSTDTSRKPSVNEIQFDESQQLLLEASQALSSSALPTHHSHKHRKTESNSSSTTTAGGVSVQKEIEFKGPNDEMERQSSTGPFFKSVHGPKSEEQVLQEKVFGKAAIATEEDEQDDNYDYFENLPGEFPVNGDQFLECHRSVNNLSPVSALTTGSYLLDTGGNADDEEEHDGPMKGLRQGGATKQLPLEAGFDSDEEEDDKGTETPASSQSNGKQPSHGPASHIKKQYASGTTKSPKQGARVTRKVVHVGNQVVHDKYGDGGQFTGNVLVESRLPHGRGCMKYENGRVYDGDWKSGRWHGNGKWINPNGDL